MLPLARRCLPTATLCVVTACALLPRFVPEPAERPQALPTIQVEEQAIKQILALYKGRNVTVSRVPTHAAAAPTARTGGASSASAAPPGGNAPP